MQKRRFITLCAGAGLLALSASGHAVTSSGTIAATLTLTNGCLINGAPAQSGINFGTLDFGTHPATFSTLTAQLSGASGGNSFTVQCTDGAAYAVQITGSANTAPTTAAGTAGAEPRYLVSTTSATQGVAYSVYSDSAFNNEVLNNADIPATSTANGISSYTLYGRIQGGGNCVTVQPGIYTDTINVSVTY